MTIEDYIGELTTQERQSFQKICRKLLKHTFLVRDMDEGEKRDYFFVSRNRELFEAYMELMGFDVVLDAASGVVMLANQAAYGSTGGVQRNRVVLKKRESILLCCLWLLYSEHFIQGSGTMSMVIDKEELDYQLEKLGAAELFDKSLLSKSLDVFVKYHLVRVIGKIGEEGCRLALYPSLQFCMEEEVFAQFVEQTVARMQGTKEEAESGETEETEDDE